MTTFGGMWQDALDYAQSSETTRAKEYVNDAGRLLTKLDPSPDAVVVTRTFTVSKPSYDLSADFSPAITNLSGVERFVFNSPSVLSRTLARYDLSDILDLQATSSTGPAYAYAWDSLDTIYIQPQPAINDTLTIYYLPVWVDLVAASDVPLTIDAAFHHLLIDYAAWRLAKRNDPAGARVHKDDWDQGVVAYRTWLRRRRGGQSSIRVGYPDRVRRAVPHDNSQDVACW